jgi:photosystem II stability/assembly factor-like uncharacterized protein
MKLLNILILSFFFLNTSAQTNVPAGTVSGTWTLAGSPYLIEGTVQIPNDSTLTIEPGVTVDFQGPYKINVKGRLLAIGTITDTINFIAPNDSAGVRGIRFENTLVANDTSKIIYCKLQYGTSDYALYFSNFSKAIILNCNISYCSSYGLPGGSGGAGIYCYNSSPIISNNLISHNSSYGIYCDYGCNSIISNNIISNNAGTGIYCYPNKAIISNNIISNNSGSNGGGIYCHNYFDIPTIINNTIINNSANYGGGIYFNSVFGYSANTNENPSLFNNIIWGNTASIGGSQVYLAGEGSDPNFYYCDVQGGSTAFDVNGTTYTGNYQNNIDLDPLFVAPSGGSGTNFNGLIADWSLQNNSPCIDAGNPLDTAQVFMYPAKDIAGNPRVNICRIDMGAYEYQTGVPTLTLSLNISQPILCNGASTGEIAVVASGGTTPYSYVWSSGQTTGNITGLNAGNYTLTVSETNGCSITKSITLMQPLPILVDLGTDKTTICNGLVQLEAEAKWITLNSGTTSQLRSVYFVNQDTGFVVGNQGVILKTTNGGVSWLEAPHTTFNNLNSVFFTDTNTGYIVGDYGIILKTFDGGTNWITLQASGANYNLNSVYFTDANIGYASGGPNSGGVGTILKTINGGTNWLALTSGTTNFLNSIYFTDANTGYTVGNNGVILKTINGGTNWIPQTSGTTIFLISVYFTDANTGYAVGGNGVALKTINGGTNWTQNISGTGNTFRSVYFSNSNTGYMCGGVSNYGAILKTSNSGINWNPQNSGTTSELNSIHFPTPNTGYAVGYNGTILKSSFGYSYSGTEMPTYSWLPTTGLDSDTIANPTASVQSNQTYAVTVTTANGCITTDSINISLIPLDAPEICIVGVDNTNKNMIVWNKPLSSAIDSFYVYRETNTTNFYQKIGAVNYDSLSVFIDVNSYPNVQSNRYKISIKDDCELESVASEPHQTMHLSINQGIGNTWNLIWDSYEGFIVSTYNIFRGTSPDTLELIGTSSGNSSQYSDLTPPTGYVYYQVEVVSPNSCNPTRAYNSSRSNIASNNVNSVIDNNNEEALISIYPNPTQNEIHIASSNPDLLKQSLIGVFNIQGEQVMNYQYQHTDIVKLDVSEFANGVYIIKMKTKNNVVVKRFIKQ